MHTRTQTLIAFGAVLLAGCQAAIYGTADDLGKIALGMPRADVVATLGQPVAVGADADRGEETLVYKRMQHAISAWPRTYTVTLREGKVVRYGEQPGEVNVNQR